LAVLASILVLEELVINCGFDPSALV